MSTIAEYFASTLMRGINEGIGTSGVVQSFAGVPADGALELPVGATGPTGEQGSAAPPFRWEGDIADPAALTALAPDLGPAQAGKAWRVESTNTVMFWNGSSFDAFPDGFGAAGPDGSANTLSIGTVTTGTAGSDLVISVTGTPPTQTMNLTIPRGVQGVKGATGGPGPIREATDYQESATPVDGAMPMWSASAGKWQPTPAPGWRGPWTITETTAWDGGSAFAASVTNVSTNPNTIAIVNIPAQDVAWRPMVLGGAQVRSASGIRLDLEACIGSAAGQVVAVGSGVPDAVWAYNQLLPQYQTSALTPASSTGTIAAGVAGAIYLVLRRNLGSGNYSYSRQYAHVAVWAVPVTGAP
ncbi:hypothetical protein OIE68_15605 [Nocardia vinacea]|uniref:hypothetical protein n=1 Tax=Nocardia vinacea TaxID=96468 RepID=UPI002E0E00EC|nr:hypothetical protein OIE68_15605 [Nocardia vinacea]